MANILLAFVTVLQEVSERIGGTALPVEIVLQILLRWGGMVSPAVLALRGDEGSRRVRDCIVKQSRSSPYEFGGIECYCNVHKLGGMIQSKYDSSQVRCVVKCLENGEQVSKRLRVRRVNAHLRYARHAYGRDDYWCTGECGTFWLWFRYLRNQQPEDELLERFGGIDFVAARQATKKSSKLSLSLAPARYRRHHILGRCLLNTWKEMIEELQGQPLKDGTEIKNYVEGWKLYLRADAGERV